MFQVQTKTTIIVIFSYLDFIEHKIQKCNSKHNPKELCAPSPHLHAHSVGRAWAVASRISILQTNYWNLCQCT